MQADINLGILVLSCDKYSSLWPIFFDRWETNWKNCSYPMYLLNNHGKWSRAGVNVLSIGDDRSWSENLLMALERINEDNVLLMIEDAVLNEPIDENLFSYAYEKFIELDMNYLNLKSSPAPNGPIHNHVGEITPGSIYRTALVPCLWKKNTLKNLLVDGESAWDFEFNGSQRSVKYNDFYSLDQNIFKWIHCVVKGKITREAADILEKTGELERINLPVMNLYEDVKLKIKDFRSKAFNLLVPNGCRLKIRIKLRGIKK